MKDRFLIITILAGVFIGLASLLYLNHAGKVQERARQSGFAEAKPMECRSNHVMGPIESRYDPTNGTVSGSGITRYKDGFDYDPSNGTISE